MQFSLGSKLSRKTNLGRNSAALKNLGYHSHGYGWNIILEFGYCAQNSYKCDFSLCNIQMTCYILDGILYATMQDTRLITKTLAIQRLCAHIMNGRSCNAQYVGINPDKVITSLRQCIETTFMGRFMSDVCADLKYVV